jgi:Arc/MetJ family transcription regulator
MKQKLPARARLHPWNTIRALSRDLRYTKSRLESALAEIEAFRQHIRGIEHRLEITDLLVKDVIGALQVTHKSERYDVALRMQRAGIAGDFQRRWQDVRKVALTSSEQAIESRLDPL